MLTLTDVRVAYGRTEVLGSVSFTIPERSVVALLGGNGSGKSTTLNAISGLVRRQGGTITFRGRRIDGLAPDAIVKAGLVQVPQGREVFPDLTVHENLELGAVVRRDTKAVRDDMMSLYERFPRLRERRRQPAAALSGGEQQQLAIARALMARPTMMLMDEPSAGLAPRIVEDIVNVIRELRREGMTVLIVEQNVGVALAVASDAYILRDGVVAMHGSTESLRGNPDVIRSYLG